MVITGVVIYTGIALSSWAHGRTTALVDLFNSLQGPLPVEILVQNLQAFTPALAAVTAAEALVVAAIAAIVPSSRPQRRGDVATGRRASSAFRYGLPARPGCIPQLHRRGLLDFPASMDRVHGPGFTR